MRTQRTLAERVEGLVMGSHADEREANRNSAARRGTATNILAALLGVTLIAVALIAVALRNIFHSFSTRAGEARSTRGTRCPP